MDPDQTARLMKYYILNMKYQRSRPTFDIFKNFLQLSIQIEEAIALSIDKVEPYKQK
jgi:hypothetical protein